jgi:NHS family xanthosine MFS transporter
MMMTNGLEPFRSFTLGWAIDKYFTKSFNNTTELAGFLQTETTNL